MDFSLTDDQRELQAAFGRLFDDHASIAVVRASEPVGFSPELWLRVGELGVPHMATADATDGAAASLSQLIVIAEEYGRRLAPVPLIESVTAARALDRAGMTVPEAGILTFAPRPLDVFGSAPLLAAGAIADAAIALVGDELVQVELDGDPSAAFVSNLGSSPLGDRTLGGERNVLARGNDARPAFDRALDDWKVLTAAALIGLALEAHRITLVYVKERKAFGVPIGWFQTVAHQMADSINDLDGARFLTHKAAWAVDAGAVAAPLVSMAYSYVTGLVERVTAECLHFHGGIGYTLEHDIQLYFRRAKSWPLIVGDPRGELAVLSTRLFGARRDS